MSGSPVYAKMTVPQGSQASPYLLVGMVVNGSQDSLDFVGQQQLSKLAFDVMEYLQRYTCRRLAVPPLLRDDESMT